MTLKSTKSYKTLVLTELCYQYHAMAPPMNLAMDQNSNIAVLYFVYTLQNGFN